MTSAHSRGGTTSVGIRVSGGTLEVRRGSASGSSASAATYGVEGAGGSLTLEGSALTDAADADAGSVTGSAISVGLGTLAAGTTRTITFQVKID